MEEFEIKRFEEASKRRRDELARYKSEQKARKQKYNIIKGIIAGGTTIVIMGVGLIKYFPSMFIDTKATSKTNSYSDTKPDRKSDVKVTALQSDSNHQDNVKYKSKKKYKITKKEIDKNTIKSSQNEENDSNNVKLTIGGYADDQVAEFLDTYVGSLIKYYSGIYGVDPSIIGAICMTETSLQHDLCLPGGAWYNGYGVGICGLENPDGTVEVTAYNYETGNYDSIYITLENACDIERNIQIGCMLFQNSLDYFDGNILMAIQSHNFSKYMVDLILNVNFKNPEAIKKDYTNIEWLDYMEDAHNNPQNYIDWEGKYGGSKYVESVLSNCPSNVVTYNTSDEVITLKLDTLQIISREPLNVNNKKY